MQKEIPICPNNPRVIGTRTFDLPSSQGQKVTNSIDIKYIKMSQKLYTIFSNNHLNNSSSTVT